MKLFFYVGFLLSSIGALSAKEEKEKSPAHYCKEKGHKPGTLEFEFCCDRLLKEKEGKKEREERRKEKRDAERDEAWHRERKAMRKLERNLDPTHSPFGKFSPKSFFPERSQNPKALNNF